jgi:hypothetical protein
MTYGSEVVPFFALEYRFTEKTPTRRLGVFPPRKGYGNDSFSGRARHENDHPAAWIMALQEGTCDLRQPDEPVDETVVSEFAPTGSEVSRQRASKGRGGKAFRKNKLNKKDAADKLRV